jgi:hypothetical protein
MKRNEKIIVNGEYKTKWKTVAVAYFRVLSPQLPEENDKYYKTRQSGMKGFMNTNERGVPYRDVQFELTYQISTPEIPKLEFRSLYNSFGNRRVKQGKAKKTKHAHMKMEINENATTTTKTNTN